MDCACAKQDHLVVHVSSDAQFELVLWNGDVVFGTVRGPSRFAFVSGFQVFQVLDELVESKPLGQEGRCRIGFEVWCTVCFEVGNKEVPVFPTVGDEHEAASVLVAIGLGAGEPMHQNLKWAKETVDILVNMPLQSFCVGILLDTFSYVGKGCRNPSHFVGMTW